MSAIQGKTDVENTFLSRREITCDFNGLGGSLTKIQALEMVTKEYGLDGKTVVPMILENHVGRTQVTGTFYVYDDVKLAKSHVIPNIFARLEKANAKIAEKAEEEEKKKASAKEAEKDLVQGIILVAAAFVHHQKFEDDICSSIFRRALEKLNNSNDEYYGIDIDTLRSTVINMRKSGNMMPFLI